jgi:hypothetical protein
MIDVVYEYHSLAIIPIRDHRNRTAAEEQRYNTLLGLLQSPVADVGERRWARVGLVRSVELITAKGERLRVRLVDASAGGFRITAESSEPIVLAPGDSVEVRVREKKRPTFAAKGGVVKLVEDKRALSATQVDMPEEVVAFEKTEVGIEPSPEEGTTYRFPCTVVWYGGAQSGLQLTGLPRET